MVASPFQTLCCVQPVEDEQAFLLAASGPIITTFDLKHGSFLSRWPPSKDEIHHIATNEDEEDRPAKRQKLDEDLPAELHREESEESIEIISERKKGERRKPKVESSTLPNVSHIIVTSDGKTVIAVTAEDKSVSVFDIQTGGVLNLRNKRSMPKRICAIVLTPDEKDILVGDKFGDVYLLPLHPTEGWIPPTVHKDQGKRPFIPSATELTVHTKGNLDALRQQQQQKDLQPKKEGLQFEHKLLLGHVSLLTDVAITEVSEGLKRRQYILTADRDEHIRVSRGITQAHIIENYCLGHREFVSKLCIVPWNPELLVAGSGEPSLKVYRWQTGHLLDQELFSGDVKQDIVNCLDLGDGERSPDRLTISNIWPIHYTVSGSAPRSGRPPHLLLVAFEGLPLLLSYSLTDEGQLRHHQTLTMGGNVLDVSAGPALWEIVVSIDTVHKPGSMKILKPEDVRKEDYFETFELFSDAPEDVSGEEASTDIAPEIDLRWESSSLAVLLSYTASRCEKGNLPSDAPLKEKNKSNFSPAGEILYGLENLRKKRGLVAAEDEQAEAEGEEEVVLPGAEDIA
ncbi:tRNA (guanine-N(7)-)-methyltransferase non-catalytic subunit trm82 [Cladophialophora chaetospira]|uniref:tRNA (Guanine-N(7)-)-methyltransferase non-catalytic subunit trm82 n=1 Tax=Cladophialophora chaetospira TaxID=386627 RepID=A0AA38XJ78_9EURO|nr:tRNA (guanine-N(7)-)-methyltransferase non-catalytic subunit trm82 [Cladophialophora chaetospira]